MRRCRYCGETGPDTELLCPACGERYPDEEAESVHDVLDEEVDGLPDEPEDDR